MKLLTMAFVVVCAPVLAAQGTASAAADPWKALSFLEGTWEAKVQDSVTTSGLYTFQRELGGHILARHSTTNPDCKGPASFDCEHSDLLYVYQEAPGQSLKAIYFDNEGHVVHYDVSAPTPTKVVFLSEPSPGPQFRLVYELIASRMTGKFQMRMPGQTDFRSHLEWVGAKH